MDPRVKPEDDEVGMSPQTSGAGDWRNAPAIAILGLDPRIHA